MRERPRTGHRRRLSIRLLGAAVLGLTLAGCHSPDRGRPADLDLSLSRSTRDGLYRVSLVPPAAPLPLNRIHTWRIRLTSRSGAPVDGATISVDGGMPEHGHGLPTRPRVVPAGSDGLYALQGMKFSMTGWWEIRLGVHSPIGSDAVTINVILPPAAS
ncbi:FixH family protein [Burkholderia sp. Ac-20379]|uniref:FixH family protein n=1 Tax=Burkholderia sp. Ac-20379 TaxID=2703900 RepID=UPI001F11F864|nr:FixH family protein [Burkholderia sp. Ac-20379]